GMSAKPIIDIDIVIDDWAVFPNIVNQLALFGYRHIGDLGIKEREAFKLDNEAKYQHNLYVCHKDSIAYRNHVLLKKHLTENPRDFTRYKELKLGLAESVENVDEYCRSKTDLILEILAKEGVPEKDLDQIRSENLS
ncbi:MAG: GrpB family protein, partial [Candidatus Bathyarchaeota archaeon]|nr:GrpB family protein [Candidatus Bathyarchaeota archaeon]